MCDDMVCLYGRDLLPFPSSASASSFKTSSKKKQKLARKKKHGLVGIPTISLSHPFPTHACLYTTFSSTPSLSLPNICLCSLSVFSLLPFCLLHTPLPPSRLLHTPTYAPHCPALPFPKSSSLVPLFCFCGFLCFASCLLEPLMHASFHSLVPFTCLTYFTLVGGWLTVVCCYFLLLLKRKAACFL